MTPSKSFDKLYENGINNHFYIGSDLEYKYNKTRRTEIVHVSSPISYDTLNIRIRIVFRNLIAGAGGCDFEIFETLNH